MESFLFLRIFGLTALGRSVFLVTTQFYSSYFIIELSEFFVFLNISRGLVGKGSNELIDLERSSGHAFAHLHQSALSDYFIDGFLKLNNKNITFPPVYPSVTWAMVVTGKLSGSFAPFFSMKCSNRALRVA